MMSNTSKRATTACSPNDASVRWPCGLTSVAPHIPHNLTLFFPNMLQLPVSLCHRLRFSSWISTVIVVVWFACAISLYWNSPIYQLQIGQFYESRWLLSCVAINIFFIHLLLRAPSEVLFATTLITTQYAIVYSTTSLCVYSYDSVSIAWQSSPDRQSEIVRFLRLSVTLALLSAGGVIVSLFNAILLTNHVCSSTTTNAINRKNFIQVLACLHGLFAIFSIYICSEITVIQATYVHAFVVQQLACSLLALVLDILQAILCSRHSRLTSFIILMGNLCQLIQELFQAWNAYYVCIYIRSIASSMGTDFSFHQVMISLILFSHGFRMSFSTMIILYVFREYIVSETLQKITFMPDSDRLTSSSQAAKAAKKDDDQSNRLFLASLCLSLGYALTDFGYFYFSGQFHRRLTASTGMSLFYVLFIGLTFHTYRRTKYAIILKVNTVLSIFLGCSSLHTLYLFIEDYAVGSVSSAIYKEVPSRFLFGADFALAFLAGIYSILSVRFSTRTVLLHTVLASQPTTVNIPLKILNHLATTNILISAIEFTLIVMMKMRWKLNDPAINFGVLDWINTLSTCVLQKWVCMYERYQSCLLILMLQLVCDCLSAVSFFSAQTNYVQMTLTLAFSSYETDKLRELLPIDHLVVIVIDHCLQLLQWMLALCSLGCCHVLLGYIVTPPKNNDEPCLTEPGDVSENGTHEWNNIVFESDQIEILPVSSVSGYASLPDHQRF